MKRNLLKVMSLIGILGINNGCTASTGLSFFSTLSDRYQSTILPKAKPQTSTIAPKPVPAPALAPASAPVSTPAQVPAPAPVPTITPTPAPASKPAPAAFADMNNKPKITKNPVQNNTSFYDRWIAPYIPSQNTVSRAAFTAVAGFNAFKRWNQVVSAYNRTDIKSFITSACLATISTAGALVASNSNCYEKMGPLSSTVLMGITAADALWQAKFSRVDLGKSNLSTIITNKSEKQSLKCFYCQTSLCNATSVELDTQNTDRQMDITNNQTVTNNAGLNFTIHNSSENKGLGIVCMQCASINKV